MLARTDATRFRLRVALVSAVLAFASSAPAKMSSVPASSEVYAGHELVGFWPFVHDGRFFFGVVERRDTSPTSVFATARLEKDGRASVTRRMENDNDGIRTIDARVVGPDLALVMERNQDDALLMTSAPLAAFVDPHAAPPRFHAPSMPTLSAAQQARVQVAPSAQWSVPHGLAPSRWLFDPRFVVGVDESELVVDTTDGHAFVIDGADVGIANAALPQRLVTDKRRTLAFLRFAKPYAPFWMLRRYGQTTRSDAGALWVRDDDGAEHDLSSTLALGPVRAFALARGPEPTIFVLREVGSTVRLVMLVRRGTWTQIDERPLAGGADRIRALYDVDTWHILYATKSADRETLRYVRLTTH